LYIKIDALFYTSLHGIHGVLCEIYSEIAVDCGTLSLWASSFHEGQTGVEGDPQNTVARWQTPSWHFTVMLTVCFHWLSWHLLLFLILRNTFVEVLLAVV